jgi:hypothetical protein
MTFATVPSLGVNLYCAACLQNVWKSGWIGVQVNSSARPP